MVHEFGFHFFLMLVENILHSDELVFRCSFFYCVLSSFILFVVYLRTTAERLFFICCSFPGAASFFSLTSNSGTAVERFKASAGLTALRQCLISIREISSLGPLGFRSVQNCVWFWLFVFFYDTEFLHIALQYVDVQIT